jgi:hypothetical protein
MLGIDCYLLVLIKIFIHADNKIAQNNQWGVSDRDQWSFSQDEKYSEHYDMNSYSDPVEVDSLRAHHGL